MYINW